MSSLVLLTPVPIRDLYYLHGLSHVSSVASDLCVSMEEPSVNVEGTLLTASVELFSWLHVAGEVVGPDVLPLAWNYNVINHKSLKPYMHSIVAWCRVESHWRLFLW